jgi:hypothetical protein
MACTLASSTSRASVLLPEPLTPVTATRRCSGTAARPAAAGCAAGAAHVQVAAAASTARRGCSGCFSGWARQPAGHRVGLPRQVGHRALGHQPAAALAGAGADVDDVVGAADGVLVVLHHHQRVALVAQLGQRVQQDAVVARVQADGRLVQHVAHALQVAAQLRRQADALRLAAAERGRGAVQRQVAQAHLFQELEPARISLTTSRAISASRPCSAARGPRPCLAHRQARDSLMAWSSKVTPREAGFSRAPWQSGQGSSPGLRPRPLRREALLAALVVVVAHRVVERLALLARQRQAGADAGVHQPCLLL